MRTFGHLLLFAASAASAAADSGKLYYEQEGFDLETGTVYQQQFPGYFPEPVDFHFAYNAQTPNHTRLFQEYPAEVAFLDGKPFESVCASDVPSLAFTQNLIDEPFDYDDTFVVKTALGGIFKVGRPQEVPGFEVTFEYVDLLACPADIDCDGEVGQSDLGALLSAYGTCEGQTGYNPKANLAPGPSPLCSGALEGIDQADLGALLAAYGCGSGSP